MTRIGKSAILRQEKEEGKTFSFWTTPNSVINGWDVLEYC